MINDSIKSEKELRPFEKRSEFFIIIDPKKI